MDAALIERLLDLTIEIQQIPAPSFAELPRAEFLASRFREAGLEEVSIDESTNVYARLPGEGASRPLVASAHTDTVFPADTDLSITRGRDRITGPGIGDNSLGVAGLFGLLWNLQAQNQSLPGDLWLVANASEEGLGDLRGMRAVVDRFASDPLAYVILEGMLYGHVYHRGLGVRRYRLSVRTPGGHSWGDHGSPSAIHELAALVNALTALEIPQDPRSVLNVGVISGGTSVNSIASQAEMELDLRSVSVEALRKLSASVEKLVKRANAKKVKVSAEVVGDRPAGEVPADHPLVELAAQVLNLQGVVPELNVGSTDANIPLSRGYPAICIGLTHGGASHTTEEYILTKPLGDGLAQVVEVVRRAYEVLA